MRTNPSRFKFVLILILQWLAGISASGAEVPEKSGEELVRQALKYEIAGDNELRQAALDLAIASFPDYAPARWHAGSIQVGGAWLAVEAVERRVAKDGRVLEYRRLRDQHAGSATGQEALARWCRKYNLPDYEAVHWAQMLRLNPDHREAKRRLAVLGGNRERRPTKEEIERLELRRKEFDKQFESWYARIRPMVTAIESGDPVERETAIERFQAIDDAAAIPAMRKAMSETKADLTGAYVRAMGNIKVQFATDTLVSCAVDSPDEALRNFATEKLKARPLLAYVPRLLGGLETPVELSYYFNTLADGVMYGYEAVQDRPDATYVRTRGFADIQSLTEIGIRRTGEVAFVRNPLRARVPGLVRAGSQELATVRNDVAETNRRAAALNEKILDVLRQTTGQQLPNDPQAWWQWWTDYNELSPPQKRTIRDEKAWSFVQSSTKVISCSCFLRGTQVWTDTGAVLIEAVRVGDRVLSQNQETGELMYNFVLDTTVRPPSRTLRLGVGDEEIAATLGHPIWVAGKGWQMAKELEAANLLHGIHGSVPVDYIEPGPEAEAYNLVVAGCNNYFIGKHRVLVHDNRARFVTEAVLPGYVAEGE